MGGVDVEDLVQCGYIALADAVERFRPDGGYGFLSYLDNCLKTAFAECCGYRTSKRNPLDAADSLDVPISEDTETTRGDLLADPVDQYKDAERRIWLEQLDQAVGAAMTDLPAELQDTLRRYFWKGQTLEEIAKDVGESKNAIQKRQTKGLQQIRRNLHRYGLDQFVEERTPYYAHVSADSFNATHMSAVDMAVIRREALEKEYGRHN